MTLDEVFALPEPWNPTADAEAFILYGAGSLGRFAVQAMRAVGLRPLAVCDSNAALWGQSCAGIDIIPLDRALELHPGILIVVTIFTGAEMRAKLRGLGLHVASFAQLYRARLMRRNGGVPLPYGSIDDTAILRRQKMLVYAGLGLWADEASRREYVAQVQYRLTLDDTCLPPSLPPADIYFPPEQPFAEKEMFVDVGAFDGDTIRAYFQRIQTARVVAVEPDPENAVKLRALKDCGLGGGFFSQIRIVQAAAMSHDGRVCLEANGTAGAAVISSGGRVVTAVKLDTVLAEESPTRMKFDVEGSELPALVGAAKTIQRCTPMLAVCLYHKPEDLWTIPAYLKSLVPGYSLYLHRYSDDCWELVCNAVKE